MLNLLESMFVETSTRTLHEITPLGKRVFGKASKDIGAPETPESGYLPHLRDSRASPRSHLVLLMIFENRTIKSVHAGEDGRELGVPMPANHNEIEKRLWGGADELLSNSGLKSSEYSVPVLGLIFLPYADHKFAEIEKELEDKVTAHRGPREKSLARRCSRYDSITILPSLR